MTVVKLPSASPSYVRVRKSRRAWLIQIVTPCEGGKPLYTTVATCPDEQSAIYHGKDTARRMQRPFKAPLGGEA
jgi:hypothetical protein